eukprot:tig00021348_g20575.t1
MARLGAAECEPPRKRPRRSGKPPERLGVKTYRESDGSEGEGASAGDASGASECDREGSGREAASGSGSGREGEEDSISDARRVGRGGGSRARARAGSSGGAGGGRSSRGRGAGRSGSATSTVKAAGEEAAAAAAVAPRGRGRGRGRGPGCGRRWGGRGSGAQHDHDHEHVQAPARVALRGRQQQPSECSEQEDASNELEAATATSGPTKPGRYPSTSRRRGAAGFLGVTTSKNGRGGFKAMLRCPWEPIASKATRYAGVWTAATDAARWRDRFEIALRGPGPEGLPPLNFPLEGYRDEPFFASLFGPGEPPPVGVHDPRGRGDREGAFARLRDWMFALPAFESERAALPRPRLPPLQRHPATGASLLPALACVATSDHARSLPNPRVGFFGVMPCRATFFARVTWLNIQFHRVFANSEEAARCRDRIALCCFGPEAAAQRSLNFPLQDYEHESFYRALFVDDPPEAVGVHDPNTKDRKAAASRLRAFLARHDIVPLEKPSRRSAAQVQSQAHMRRPDTGLYGVYPAQAAPLRYAAYVPWRRRQIRSLWYPEHLEEAGRWRDRLLIALRGPAVAERKGLNHPLQEYEGEEFYLRLFGEAVVSGEADPPPIGAHDPLAAREPAAAARRAVQFIEEHGAAGEPRCICEGAIEEDQRSEAAGSGSEDGDSDSDGDSALSDIDVD